MLNKKPLIFFLLSTFYFLLSINPVQAARLFLVPSSGTYKVGQEFTVEIRLDTQGEQINAIDLGLLYPSSLTVLSVSKSGSILQLWVQEPGFSKSDISLSGGVPSGASTHNALIAKAKLRAKAVSSGSLAFSPETSVLLNDGNGTKASLEVGGLLFSIVTAEKNKSPSPTPTGVKGVSPSPVVSLTPLVTKTPEVLLLEDKNKPQKFEIFVGHDQRVFEGKYFASFFTTDAESGVDHYELKEGSGLFRVAQSPFLLSDQKLQSIIRVRVYDGAGNYRESIYPGFLKRILLKLKKSFLY